VREVEIRAIPHLIRRDGRDVGHPVLNFPAFFGPAEQATEEVRMKGKFRDGSMSRGGSPTLSSAHIGPAEQLGEKVRRKVENLKCKDGRG
jgi:hypothetical protein